MHAFRLIAALGGVLVGTSSAQPGSMGCHGDDESDRVLTAKWSSESMTPEVCARHCQGESARYTYYATQYGRECWCQDDSLELRHGAGTCDYECAGDSGIVCGGYDSFSLYDLTDHTPAPPTDNHYVGCYADDRHDRVLGAMTSSNDMTSEVCAAYCIDEDSRNMYYATQYGVECWCAVDVDRRHGDGTCDYPCAGNSAVSCGGFDAFDLFELERDETPAEPMPAAPTEDYYEGCFADEKDDRVLGDMISTRDMTLELCEDHCSSMNKPFFSLQYGRECWCGGCELLDEGSNKYDRHGTTSCVDYPCTGESTRQCGARDAFSLYYRGECDSGDTPAPTKAPTPAPYTGDTPAPTKTPTAAPYTGDTPAPTKTPTQAPYTGDTPAPTNTPTLAPYTATGEEEFEDLDIPDDLEELILADAAGGFAGPGNVTFSDSSPDPILASEADSFVVEGVFETADGEPLDPSTILYLYIFQDTSSGSAAEASRGTAAVDPATGAFTAAVTDAPAGSSTLVLSFVLGEDGGGDGRRLARSRGRRSVHTVPVENETECQNALGITLTWDDGDSDLDLWVLEPGGQDVGWTNLNGDFGFLDFDNTVGLGPENYVLTKDLAYNEALFGTYTFRLHGFRVWDEDNAPKTVNYKVVVRKEGEEIILQEGSITHDQWTPDTTVEVEKKYVLAVGGRPLNGILGTGGTLNHYSLMQWEGLFPCLPEIDDDGDLQERLRTAFQEEYPTTQAVPDRGIQLLRSTGYTAWTRDENLVLDDCWEQDGVSVSRLYFTDEADVIMPVQWDMDGDDIWNNVVTNANDYLFAEPPVPGAQPPEVGGVELRTHTRWPLTLYQASVEGAPGFDDANNSNTFIRWLVAQVGAPFREIDESFADAYPGRLTPAETDEAGNPLNETFYGPIWDSDADEPATPAPTVGGLDECFFDL